MAHHAKIRHPEVQQLSIKRLVLKALREGFKDGASSTELLGHFASAWGRDDIVRTSLSPILSKMRNDGILEFKEQRWHLTEHGAEVSKRRIIFTNVKRG